MPKRQASHCGRELSALRFQGTVRTFRSQVLPAIRQAALDGKTLRRAGLGLRLRLMALSVAARGGEAA